MAPGALYSSHFCAKAGCDGLPRASCSSRAWDWGLPSVCPSFWHPKPWVETCSCLDGLQQAMLLEEQLIAYSWWGTRHLRAALNFCCGGSGNTPLAMLSMDQEELFGPSSSEKDPLVSSVSVWAHYFLKTKEHDRALRTSWKKHDLSWILICVWQYPINSTCFEEH